MVLGAAEYMECSELGSFFEVVEEALTEQPLSLHFHLWNFQVAERALQQLQLLLPILISYFDAASILP